MSCVNVLLVSFMQHAECMVTCLQANEKLFLFKLHLPDPYHGRIQEEGGGVQGGQNADMDSPPLLRESSPIASRGDRSALSYEITLMISETILQALIKDKTSGAYDFTNSNSVDPELFA